MQFLFNYYVGVDRLSIIKSFVSWEGLVVACEQAREQDAGRLSPSVRFVLLNLY